MKKNIFIISVIILLSPIIIRAQTFETTQVYTNSSYLPQGETEIVTTDSLIVVAWMDGSPYNATEVTLRTAYSVDNGNTYSASTKVDSTLLMADPVLKISPNGKIYLSSLRKDSPIQWEDIAVILYNSDDNGQSWNQLNVINDDNVFNDRDWMTIDSLGNIYVVYSPRIMLPDSNYDRSVYIQKSIDDGFSFQQRVLVNDTASRTANTSGGSARSIAMSDDGDIAVLVQAIPENNSKFNGGGILRSNAYVYISHDAGQSFSNPILMTRDSTIIPFAGYDSTNNPFGFKPFPRLKTYDNNFYGVWIGENTSDSISVYFSKLADGDMVFSSPVELYSDTSRSITLADLEIDNSGGIHLFWIGRISSDYWNVFYSESTDGGSTFSTPQTISPFSFPIIGWPGDFNSVSSNSNDVFYSWSVPTGTYKGVYVTAIRNAVLTIDFLPTKLDLFQINPNPSNNKISVQPKGFYSVLEVSIFDILGRNILDIKNQTEIDINSLITGTYLVKVKIDGKIGISKILKIE